MTLDYDVIVIGAGMSGMYQLHRLRGLGLRVRVFEAGDGVGGTWYWNRYPGARFDSESWTYGYSFSDDILRDWEWSEHFAAQPETLRYCNFVADKLHLRRDIEFGCRITAAVYDEAAGEWEIETADGRRVRARRAGAHARSIGVVAGGGAVEHADNGLADRRIIGVAALPVRPAVHVERRNGRGALDVIGIEPL